MPGFFAKKHSKGYPTWEIPGVAELIPGERSLQELADLSGFKGATFPAPAAEAGGMPLPPGFKS